MNLKLFWWANKKSGNFVCYILAVSTSFYTEDIEIEEWWMWGERSAIGAGACGETTKSRTDTLFC